MNIGFLFGFSLAGYFQLTAHYSTLFLMTAANNMLALIILFTQWKYMADKNTLFSTATRHQKYLRVFAGIVIVFALLPALNWMLQHTTVSDDLVLSIGALVAIALIFIAARNQGANRRKLFAFIILLLSAQIVWIIYQLAPMGLTLFAKDNVDRQVLGFLIAPGWIQNINSVTIIIGAPLLGILFIWLKNKIKSPILPLQYSAGLIISGLALLILPIGISLSSNGYTAFGWLFTTYVFQAIAELLISPIGYSMVGQLVPARWQSICMGSTLLNSGVAAVLSSFFSNAALGKSGSSNPLVSNPSYSHMFTTLGWSTVAVGVLLILITPWLNKLIQD
jgi:POT family proton-dependent oligopeptide transporter